MIQNSRENITDIDLPRATLLHALLKGRILTYRRSFLDYVHWWLIFAVVVVGLVAIYILIPGTIFSASFEIFVPLTILAVILHKKFNRKYVLSKRGIAFKMGLLSLTKSEQAVAYSKMRGVEIRRTIMQRIFNVGDVCVNTILGDRPEVVMKGIYNPNEMGAVIEYFIELSTKSEQDSGAKKPRDQIHTALYVDNIANSQFSN